MVSCLILYRSDITSWIKCFLLRAIFMEEDFEIHVIESSTVILFAWNVDKASIWQAAMLFESAGVLMGYGFGKRKRTAYTAASAIPAKRKKMDYPHRNSIHEARSNYVV